MTEKPLRMSPDEDLAKELRRDLTARSCVTALMDAVIEMAEAVGVKVEWSIINVDENVMVNRNMMVAALCRLSTAGGAMLVGSKINPMTALDTQSLRHMTHNHRQEKDDNVQ